MVYNVHHDDSRVKLGRDRCRAHSFGVVFQEIVDIQNKFLTGVTGHVDLFGVHPNRVAGAGLDTESAKDTAEEIDVVNGRIFFDLGIRTFRRDNLDAFGGASSGAEHAGGASDRSIRTFHQSMLGPVILWNRFQLVGIFESHHLLNSKEMLDEVLQCR